MILNQRQIYIVDWNANLGGIRNTGRVKTFCVEQLAGKNPRKLLLKNTINHRLQVFVNGEVHIPAAHSLLKHSILTDDFPAVIDGNLPFSVRSLQVALKILFNARLADNGSRCIFFIRTCVLFQLI